MTRCLEPWKVKYYKNSVYLVSQSVMQPTSIKLNFCLKFILINTFLLSFIEIDRWEMRESVKLAREILAQPAFEQFCDYEIKPGIDVQSDEAIDEFVRENSETEYHPSCSCRMGDSNENDTVVGFDGKVVGKISFYSLSTFDLFVTSEKRNHEFTNSPI